MKYTAYESYIDFLFSPEAKEDPYLNLRVDIVSAGDVGTYCPSDGSYVIPADSIHTIEMKYLSPSSRIVLQAGLLGENNGQYAETDLTYEEVFNEPALGKIDQCEYISDYAYKAYWDYIINKSSSNDTNQDAQAQTGYNDDERIEILATVYQFYSGFNELEYDKYQIPLTFLNGEEAAVTATNWKTEGDKLSVSSGALISIDKPKTNEVIPVGYIDFMKLRVCNYYELQFDPTGFLKLM